MRIPVLLLNLLFLPLFFCGCERFRGGSGVALLSEDTTLSLVVREWSKRIEKNPENSEYRIGRAEALVKDHEYQLALQDVQKAIELRKNDPAYYALKGDIQMVLNQSFDASKTYQEAAAKFPDDLQSQINLGRFQLIVRQYENCKKSLESAMQIGPNSVEALFLKGMLFKETGDTMGAILQFEQCAKFDPANTDAHIQIGQLYTALRDSSGIIWFTRAIQQDPLDDEAYYGRGLLYQTLSQDEAALRDYQQTVDLNASHYLAYYNTGYILFARKNWDRAIEHFRIAVKFAPDFVKGHYMLGLSNEGKGNPDQAVEHYRKCLELNRAYEPAMKGLERLGKNQ